MTKRKLDELEMFDVMRLAYPERFKDESDETFDAALEFADSINGFEEIADLLGRVVMLSVPMKSGLTGKLYHCLGNVQISGGEVDMCAAVKREASA